MSSPSSARMAAVPLLKHWIQKNKADQHGIGIVELNSPSNRNALSIAMLTKLQETMESIERNPAIRVVILQAAPAAVHPSKAPAIPVFCSGHDLKEIHQFQQGAENSSSSAFRKKNLDHLFTLCSTVMTSIATSTKPYIAKVDGMATAAGCQLVASCDLAYATRQSTFATPGVTIGLFCSTPAVALTRCVAPKHAMEMLLTGSPVSADRAAEMALINRVLLDAKSLDAHVDAIAQQIANKSSTAIRMGKPAVMKQSTIISNSAGPQDAYRLASEVMVENAMAEQAREGIDAFLNKRVPKWNDDDDDRQ